MPVPCVDRGLERGRGERVAEERPGRRGASQLLEHDRELDEPGALPRVLLGDVDPGPALAGELLPEHRQRLGGCVEQRARHGGRAVPLDPAPHRAVQLLVLVRDPDRHGAGSYGPQRGI